MEPRQRKELSVTSYHLAEQYRIGLPIAFYDMRPEWIRFFQVIRCVLLSAIIGAVLFFLAIITLFFYQYLVVFNHQIPGLEEKLILSFPGTIIGLIGCIECIVVRSMLIRRVPASILVCTEGLLEILPKEVDVTRWDEIQGPLQEPGLEKRKHYKLYRKNRKPLFFGDSFEDVEDLAGLVRQYVRER